MSVIICNVNLFDAYQPIFKLDDDGHQTVLTYADTDELDEQIAAACYDNDITEVRIIGPTEYCNRVAQKISENNDTKYSNMILNIEVNP